MSSLQLIPAEKRSYRNNPKTVVKVVKTEGPTTPSSQEAHLQAARPGSVKYSMQYISVRPSDADPTKVSVRMNKVDKKNNGCIDATSMSTEMNDAEVQKLLSGMGDFFGNSSGLLH